MSKLQYNFTFQDPSGNPLNGGNMTLRLSYDAVSVSGTNVQVMSGSLINAALDSNGSVSILLWPNDQLNPTNTQYRLRAYTAQGELVYDEWMILVTGVQFLVQEVDGTSTFLLESGAGSILLETSP